MTPDKFLTSYTVTVTLSTKLSRWQLFTFVKWMLKGANHVTKSNMENYLHFSHYPTIDTDISLEKKYDDKKIKLNFKYVNKIKLNNSIFFVVTYFYWNFIIIFSLSFVCFSSFFFHTKNMIFQVISRWYFIFILFLVSCITSTF